jgi:hypothetical protein
MPATRRIRECLGFSTEFPSAPGVNRTPDLQIRSLPLYPTELRARMVQRRRLDIASDRRPAP